MKLKEFKKKSVYLLNFFSSAITSKAGLKKDVILIVATIFVCFVSFFIINIKDFSKSALSKSEQKERVLGEEKVIISEEDIYDQKIRIYQETNDLGQWENFQNKIYGFEIKYPDGWAKPLASVGDKKELRFQFRKKNIKENDSYLGFDVALYDLKKNKELSDTKEFTSLKIERLSIEENCRHASKYVNDNADYPAEEIYVPNLDNCFESAFFYSVIRGDYIYNISPSSILKEEKGALDLKKSVIDDFPDFFSIVSSFNLIDIEKSKIKKVNKAINVPRPLSAIRVDGRLVCAKKKDKPRMSKKNKEKYLDMECCLDPDEYPNPHCYYPKDKYGQYL